MQVNQTFEHYNIALLGAMVVYILDSKVRKEGQIIKVSPAGYTILPNVAKGGDEEDTFTANVWEIGKLDLRAHAVMLNHSNLYQIGTEISLDYSGLPIYLLATMDYEDSSDPSSDHMHDYGSFVVQGAVYYPSANTYSYLLHKKEGPLKKDRNTIQLVPTVI